MSGKSKSTEEAMKNASIQSVNEDELEKIIENIIEKNEGIILSVLPVFMRPPGQNF